MRRKRNEKRSKRKERIEQRVPWKSYGSYKGFLYESVAPLISCRRGCRDQPHCIFHSSACFDIVWLCLPSQSYPSLPVWPRFARVVCRLCFHFMPHNSPSIPSLLDAYWCLHSWGSCEPAICEPALLRCCSPSSSSSSSSSSKSPSSSSSKSSSSMSS